MSSLSPAKLPIRVGQLWRDRTGATHYITGVQLTFTLPDGTDYTRPFPVTDDSGCSYTLAGTEWALRHSPNDLIELLCDVSNDASETAKPPIRVGQSWLTRDNRTAVITSNNKYADTPYPVHARVHDAAGHNIATYTSDGYCFIGRESPLDLITLIADVSSDASEAVKPQLRVGQVWRDRKGDLHTIVEDDNAKHLLCSNHCWYERDGRSIIHGTSPEIELIELVSDASEAADPAPSTGEATPPFSFRTAIRQVADGTWPEALATAQAESDATDVFIGPEPYAATVFADLNRDANNIIKPHVIAISHGPDVVSRVMSDGSAWYAPTHHGIPTGPWTRYAD